ncbi:hypothetical protein JCM10914A_45350 [Paenibacillus sp. JCM 10914]
MFLNNDIVDGITVAEARPRSAREAINIQDSVEKAATMEDTPYIVTPIISSRRLPIRSPKRPIVKKNPTANNSPM